jgi:hypothetical protein
VTRAASLAALMPLTVLAAACGSSGGSADADPASAAPANAAFYVEATVRPEGQLRDDALAAAGKVLRTSDPSGRIRELVNEALEESESKIDYARDVEPWLGERVGVWVEANGESAAVVVAASDTEQALDAIEESGRREGERLTERSHHDATYFVDEDGDAGGVAGDFAVFGDEPAVKRTIDALEGDSIAEADRYRAAVDDLPEERLAHFYADIRALLQLAAREDPATAEGLRQFEGVIPWDRLEPLTGAFVANGDRVALDVGLRLPDDESLRKLGALTATASTPLVRELPGDSWLAYGLPNLGESWRTMIDEFGGAIGGDLLQQQFQNELGLDLERDLLSWIGDVAIFVRGTTSEAVDGGAVISVTDQERAAAAFGKIVGVLRTRARVAARPIQVEGAETAFAISDRSIPKPIVLARSADKVVVAYGTDAAVEAFNPSEPFGDTDAYAQAKEVLGGDFEPGFLVSMPAILSLVDATGGGDPEFEQARPYLEAFTTIAIGGGTEGDRAHAVIAAGLK